MVRLTRRGVTPYISLVDTSAARAAIEAKYPFLTEEPWEFLNNGGFTDGEGGLVGKYGYQDNPPETVERPILYLVEVYAYVSKPASADGKYFGGVLTYRLTPEGELYDDGPVAVDGVYSDTIGGLKDVLSDVYKASGEVNWVRLVGTSFDEALNERNLSV